VHTVAPSFAQGSPRLFPVYPAPARLYTSPIVQGLSLYKLGSQVSVTPVIVTTSYIFTSELVAMQPVITDPCTVQFNRLQMYDELLACCMCQLGDSGHRATKKDPLQLHNPMIIFIGGCGQFLGLLSWQL
jgi:hypothetical protein